MTTGSPTRRPLLLAALALALLAATAAAPPRTVPEGLRVADGHTRIPFDLRGQHVWVRGVVNEGDSVWIVVDTGASGTVLDQSLVRALELRVAGHHEARGAGGSQPGMSVEDVTIALPGLTLRKPRMNAIDFSAITAQSGRPMQVVLGAELFQAAVVRFDYAAGVMDVWESGKAPRDLPGARVPLTFIHRHPYVEGTLEIPGRAPMTGRFVLDSGSALSIAMMPDLVKREKLADAFPQTIMSYSRGVGGEIRNRVGRATAFTMAGLRFEQPTVVLPDSNAGFLTGDGTLGNVGGQLLGRCRVTFDYPRKQLHLEPAADFAKPFEADMTGATMTRAPGTGYTVRWIFPGGPAEQAGVRAGDAVTSVDGEPAATFDPPRLRKLLQQEGRTIRFGIARGADTLTVSLVTRRLI
jgi:predicted aspartyl protease